MADKTFDTLLCNALSAIQGTPKGRFSVLPGLGIQTRLTGGPCILDGALLEAWARSNLETFLFASLH